MADDTDPGSDSDLRRRAAWLLAMLAIAAVLFVVVVTWLVGGDSPNSSKDRPGALDSAISSESSHSSAHRSASPTRSTSPTAASSSSTTSRHTKCPTSQTCILDGDVGGGVAAINAYRTQHGQSAVTGTVSTQAQKCAVQNGNGCSGGWAETELSKADGTSAVQKILPFAHLLDPMKSVEVGWAYDPGAKLYYFAIIRNV